MKIFLSFCIVLALGYWLGVRTTQQAAFIDGAEHGAKAINAIYFNAMNGK